MAYVHVYYQKNVATIETMSEASERIKAKVVSRPTFAISPHEYTPETTSGQKCWNPPFQNSRSATDNKQ